jgi:hypothetical protein
MATQILSVDTVSLILPKHLFHGYDATYDFNGALFYAL